MAGATDGAAIAASQLVPTWQTLTDDQHVLVRYAAVQSTGGKRFCFFHQN